MFIGWVKQDQHSSKFGTCGRVLGWSEWPYSQIFVEYISKFEHFSFKREQCHILMILYKENENENHWIKQLKKFKKKLPLSSRRVVFKQMKNRLDLIFAQNLLYFRIVNCALRSVFISSGFFLQSQ